MIVEDVVFPDIPTPRTTGQAARDVYAFFISDIHVGSQEFLEDAFVSFIRWLRGHDVDPPHESAVKRARYLFIAGDLVDGIGVYPDQRQNLVIDDIYEQYQHVAELLRQVPKHIKIICIPGNHDASRQALPRPPIPQEFASSLNDLDQTLMLSDPSVVRVDGVSVLVTHGDSLDDLVTTLPSASYKDPTASMVELLKKRHLAPMYGGKTELAPLDRDWLVIDRPPDIVHFGHAHHNAVETYRGVRMINSGTFQAQTEFMKKQGVDPTPGIVCYVNLRTGDIGAARFES